MNALAQAQIANNVATEENWAAFAGHRARVTALLRARAPVSRLCVLGAGNCNDLDLDILCASHSEIHLIDLDAASLTKAVARQNPRARGAIRIHAPVDVSGHLEVMARWSPATILAADDIARFAHGPARVAKSLPGAFQLTVSNCVLSQLMDGIADTLGTSHPRFSETVNAMRLGHLRLMADITAPGGEAILVTDVLSSETCPELRQACDEDLSDLLTLAVRKGNFFHGMSPAALAATLATDPHLISAFQPPRWVKPWVWNLGFRLYLVHAVSLTRRL